MPPEAPPPQSYDPALARRASAQFGWSGAWLGAAAVAALAIWALRLPAPAEVWWALGLGAAPAAAGLALARVPAAGLGLVAVWALGATAASLLTGGLMGPLAFWCLAPLAAAGVMGRTRLAAVGGAASVASAGLAALAAVSLPAPLLAPWTDYALRLLALGSVACGLGAGVVLLQARSAGERRRALSAEVRAERLLADQPFLLVELEPSGVVRAAYGASAPGLSRDGLVGRPLAAVAAGEQARALEAALRKALAEGACETRFAPAAAPDEEVWLVLRRTGRGRLLGALRSAAWQKGREAELEAARAQAEARNAGKSRFLANMSHELRTPLNAIMGFSDIMRARLFGPLSDKYGEYAELIHESGSHLLDLINDVLDMSKIEAERFELAREEFDAREAVSAVLRLMRGQADRAGIQLRGALPKEPVMVDADRRALKQIALNLISNALKFTPKDGQVAVSLEVSGQDLALVVADTGVGIGAEDLKRIGRPYEQAGDAAARSAGTGLGLSLVRAFAELHGGEMRIESKLGEGSTVTVVMPVLLAEPSGEPREPARAASEATIH